LGLDSVELVLAIEKEFGVEIPDHDVVQISTVGQMYEWLRVNLRSTKPAQCMTQRLFYKVRRALISNHGIPKQSISLDSRLKDLVPANELKDAWPYLTLFAELDFPRLDKVWWPVPRRHSTEGLTLRELLTAMTTLNREKLVVEPGSDDDIWVRLTEVIHRQTSVDLREIQPDAHFSRDLGVD
jgi:acyl carrier protein